MLTGNPVPNCLRAVKGLVLAVLLSGSFSPARAQEYSSSTRSISGTDPSVFIGAYGEALSYHLPDRVEGEMRGPVEVVRGYSWWVKDAAADELVHPRQTPTKKDFIPENFQRLGLVQLLVIPKGAPDGFRSLAAMREGKERELGSSATRFEIQAADSSEFPEGSFSVIISTPYRLKQIYTESLDHFFILTSGSVEPALAGDFRSSLSSHVRRSFPPRPEKAGTEWSELADTSLVGWGGWALIMLFAGLLAGLPLVSGHRAALRLSLIGRSVIVSVNVFILCGVLVQGVLRSAGFLPAGGASALVLGLAAPWFFPALASRLGGKYESRAWRYLFFGLALLGFLGESITRLRFGTRLAPDFDMGQAFWIAEIFGVFCGVSFGAAFLPQVKEGDASS